MARVTPRLIALLVDGVDRSDEVSKAEIISGPKSADFVSFAEARAGGGRSYTLGMTIAQDHAAGTLFSLIYDEAGSEVEAIYAPYGNDDASVTQPHYRQDVVVSEPDGRFMGAEANSSTTAVATIDVAWAMTGKPEKITA